MFRTAIACFFLGATLISCGGSSPTEPAEPPVLSIAECEAAGGEALADPGDGSLTCPDGREELGVISFEGSGWDEGGLCCAL